MRIEFFGHACFRICLTNGLEILIDPYEIGGFAGALRFQNVPCRPDIVLISHDHPDHSELGWIGGKPNVASGDLCEKDVSVQVFDAAHDEFGGTLRGGRTKMFLIEAEGLRVFHCGDLGERLTDDVPEQIGHLDVLIVPTGGYFTLGPEGATELVRAIRPHWVLPCHYRTDEVSLPHLLPVSRFTRRFDSSNWGWHVRSGDCLELERKANTEPAVVVLRPLGTSRD